MLKCLIVPRTFFIFALFSTRLLGDAWVSANVAEGESPQFATPSEACAWYFGTSPSLKEWSFSHISSGGGIPYVVLPPGQFFCYGIWELRPDKAWNVGNAHYRGNIRDLDGKDENFYNNDAPVSEDLKELIRRSMQRFYGDQVTQWNINSTMVKVFQKWIAKVDEGCGCFKFIPKPLSSPIMSASALVVYLVKYGAQISREHEAEANYSCMLAAAAGMKTEFWLAGNLE